MTLRIPSARAQPTVQYVRDGTYHYLQIGSHTGPPRLLEEVASYAWGDPSTGAVRQYVVFPDSFKGRIQPRVVFELVVVVNQEEVESDG